jgi:zinc transporter ZupT
MRRPYQNMTIRDALLLITGIAVSFSALVSLFKSGGAPHLEVTDFDVTELHDWLDALCVLLGGLSLIGVPLLLWQRRKNPRRWGPGRTFWFATGVMMLASFGLLLAHRLMHPGGTRRVSSMSVLVSAPDGSRLPSSGPVFFWQQPATVWQMLPVDRTIVLARLLQFHAIPLFAPAWLLAILANRHLRPTFKRTSPWTERFGLLLCAAWTCAGLLCLYNLANGGPFFLADFAGEQIRIEWNAK